MAADDAPGYLLELAGGLKGTSRAMANLAEPVVVGVRGAAAGAAGLAVMLTAVLVVASHSTKFANAYPDIGLTPDCGVSYLVPSVIARIVGTRHQPNRARTNRGLSRRQLRPPNLRASLLRSLRDEWFTLLSQRDLLESRHRREFRSVCSTGRGRRK